MVKRTLQEKQILSIIEDAVYDIYLPAMEKATPKKTGKTADSWRVVTEGDVVYLMNIKFGEIVEFLDSGTRGPYVIEPKNASALKFTVNGKNVFAKKVIHPGIQARKFVDKTLNDPGIQARFSLRIDRELQKLLDGL